MFSQLKASLTERLKGPDALDKAISDLVDRATSDLLIGSDWGLNMEIVDFVSQNSR